MGYFRLITKKSESPLLWDLSVGSHFLRGDMVVQNGPRPLEICELGTWVYLKGYDLENYKNILLNHFDHLLPWKQSKMAAKHLKSLKLQSLHAE